VRKLTVLEHITLVQSKPENSRNNNLGSLSIFSGRDDYRIQRARPQKSQKRWTRRGVRTIQ
jgi:hypothetical protein